MRVSANDIDSANLRVVTVMGQVSIIHFKFLIFITVSFGIFSALKVKKNAQLQAASLSNQKCFRQTREI